MVKRASFVFVLVAVINDSLLNSLVPVPIPVEVLVTMAVILIIGLSKMMSPDIILI